MSSSNAATAGSRPPRRLDSAVVSGGRAVWRFCSHEFKELELVDGEFANVLQTRAKARAFLRVHRFCVCSQAPLSAALKTANRSWTQREIRKAHPPADQSRGDWCLIQPTTVHLPAIRTERRAGAARLGAWVWRA